jgi:hypothetical protein
MTIELAQCVVEAAARGALVEAAWSIAGARAAPRFDRTRARRGHGKAFVATARKLAIVFCASRAWKASELLAVRVAAIDVDHAQRRRWLRIRDHVSLRIRDRHEGAETVTCVILAPQALLRGIWGYHGEHTPHDAR